MQKQTQARTLIVVLSLMLFVMFNTALQLFDRYSEWYAWTMYAVMVLAVFAVLRFQQQLPPSTSGLILSLPFVLAAIGVLLGV
jgi:hypothetical protein